MGARVYYFDAALKDSLKMLMYKKYTALLIQPFALPESNSHALVIRCCIHCLPFVIVSARFVHTRVMIAIFQGFVLQQAWDPQVDADRYLATVDALLDALST